MILKPSKEWFQQSIVLVKEIPDPDDPYGEGTKEEKTQINNVRVDMKTVYSGTNNDRQVTANGVVILMEPYTTPFLTFNADSQGQKIIYQGHKYTITNINEDIEPFTTKIYQYKLTIL